MSKCEQCIVREFSSLKALTKDELLKLSTVKHPIIKREVIFEGENVNGIIKDGVCKLQIECKRQSTILKLVTKGELLGQRSMIVMNR
jgi:hypothetical protein